jgi:hypothetical protein
VGAHLYREPRNFGSAILHRGTKEKILFVLNHYPEAAHFDLQFMRDDIRNLVNLTTGVRIPVSENKTVVDIDRKACEIYRLE